MAKRKDEKGKLERNIVFDVLKTVGWESFSSSDDDEPETQIVTGLHQLHKNLLYTTNDGIIYTYNMSSNVHSQYIYPGNNLKIIATNKSEGDFETVMCFSDKLELRAIKNECEELAAHESLHVKIQLLPSDFDISWGNSASSASIPSLHANITVDDVAISGNVVAACFHVETTRGSYINVYQYTDEHEKFEIKWTKQLNCRVNTLALDRKGNTLVLGGNNGNVYLYSTDGNPEWSEVFKDHEMNTVKDVALSNEGELVAVTGNHKFVLLNNSRQSKFSLIGEDFNNVAFSDNNHVAVGFTGGIMLLNIDENTEYFYRDTEKVPFTVGFVDNMLYGAHKQYIYQYNPLEFETPV